MAGSSNTRARTYMTIELPVRVAAGAGWILFAAGVLIGLAF